MRTKEYPWKGAVAALALVLFVAGCAKQIRFDGQPTAQTNDRINLRVGLKMGAKTKGQIVALGSTSVPIGQRVEEFAKAYLGKSFKGLTSSSPDVLVTITGIDYQHTAGRSRLTIGVTAHDASGNRLLRTDLLAAGPRGNIRRSTDPALHRIMRNLVSALKDETKGLTGRVAPPPPPPEEEKEEIEEEEPEEEEPEEEEPEEEELEEEEEVVEERDEEEEEEEEIVEEREEEREEEVAKNEDDEDFDDEDDVELDDDEDDVELDDDDEADEKPAPRAKPKKSRSKPKVRRPKIRRPRKSVPKMRKLTGRAPKVTAQEMADLMP